MRILLITQFFPPDITAAAFRLGDTADFLAAEGIDVRVITSFPHKARANEPEQPLPLVDERNILRVHLPQVGVGGFRRYVRHYLSFMFGSLWAGAKLFLRGWRPDVLFASSPPIFAGLSGRILSLIAGKPFILDIRDIWPDSAVSAGQLSYGGMAYRGGKRLERHLYRHADHITCVATPMREYIQRFTSRPVTVVYNGVRNGDSHELASSSVERPVGCATRTLLYAGNLGRVQALDVLIQAVADLSREGGIDRWKIRMIGAGAITEQLRTLITELKVPHLVSIEPPMSREAVNLEMRKADALFLSLKPDDVLRMTIPSKLFDYMLAARPVLAGIEGEGKALLASTGANVCYEPNGKASLKQAFRHLQASVAQLSAAAPANRKSVLERFTRREQAAKILSIACRLASHDQN